jgi:hypothetical protein
MSRTWAFLLLLVSLAAARAEDPAPTPPEDKKPKEIALAIIVHPKNPVTKASFGELRAYLKVEQQFWPNRKRCEIYLPQTKTPEYAILLEKVYRMSHEKLQKYWVRKLFSGEIPSKPAYVPSAKAAVSRVLQSEGALSIIGAHEVPKDAEGKPTVKVLLIEGKAPGEPGYPLVGLVPPASEP